MIEDNQEINDIDSSWDEPVDTAEPVAEDTAVETKAEDKSVETKSEDTAVETKAEDKAEPSSLGSVVRKIKIAGEEVEVTEEELIRSYQQQSPIKSSLNKLGAERDQFQKDKASIELAESSLKEREERLRKDPLGYAKELGVNILTEAQKINESALRNQNMTDAERLQAVNTEYSQYREDVNKQIETQQESERLLEEEASIVAIEEEGKNIMTDSGMSVSQDLLDFYVGVKTHYADQNQAVTPKQVLEDMQERSEASVKLFVDPLSDELFYKYLKSTGMGDRFQKLELKRVKSSKDEVVDSTVNTVDEKTKKEEEKKESDWEEYQKTL